MPNPPVDVFGIVYIIENAQQFWSELEEMLHIPDGITLSRLDSTLRRFISLCAAYHEQYLQSPLQLEHACDLLVASELFTFHSERMCEIIVDDARTSTDPHYELIIYHVLLSYGRRNPSFLRSQKRWEPLLPLLIDNVRVHVDPDVDDTFMGSTSGTGSGNPRGIAVPIEAKLRSLAVKILYEVCRVQKLTLQELRIFDDSYIDYLFDLVEQTRGMHDETFNYSVIKLIVALNEQFMVASLHPQTPHVDGKFPDPQDRDATKPETTNRVLRVLMSRLGSSMTFGENMIFMLNRANRTPEDLCMQLLVLKILYLLFTTKGMSEYFYTNDLRVLVDVFLREIGNIDEDNESLRHTYLRVLHPLLTKTQLRTMPYKRAQIVQTLELLVENETIRDIDPTTKRLVARCLSGDWCVQFRKVSSPVASPTRQDSGYEQLAERISSPSPSVASAPQGSSALLGSRTGRAGSITGKNIKASRSAEHLNAFGGSSTSRGRAGSHQRVAYLDNIRQPSNDSASSLPRVAAAATANSAGSVRRRERAGSAELDTATAGMAALSAQDQRQYVLPGTHAYTQEPDAVPQICGTSPDSALVEPPESPVSALSSSSSSAIHSHLHSHAKAPPSATQRRMAPAPPKRRKPPAVPTSRSAGSMTTFTTIAASSQPSLIARR
ncbi:hypothetical protein B0H21DRAFT_745085 [Amylocystis lapponica]|nr:hypothetical protein B0H21DRAFT_745085 [Amylocystis lapponica]